jgi:hypothetical protein
VQSAQGPNAPSNQGQAGETEASGDESEMTVPPPVSGAAFPTSFGSGERSNYLSIGVMGGASYDTNILYSAGQAPVNDEVYSIWPTARIDRTTPRLHADLSYSPGFLLYQHVTALNQWSQTASGQIDYHISPHGTLNLHDTFAKTSNVFSAPYSLEGGTVSGSPETPPALVLTPYADEISNMAGGVYSYQFGRNAMFGAGGGAAELDFPNISQAGGLYNANSYDGNAFYDLRISRRQYVGVTVSYMDTTEYLTNGSSPTWTNAVLPFYTFTFGNKISVSVAGGPQYYNSTFAPLPAVEGWAPSALASIHATVARASFSLSYQRTVAAGGGLVGAFNTDSGGVDIRMQMTPSWSVGGSGSYTNNQALVPSVAAIEEGGHTLSVAESLMHNLGQHLTAEVGYDYLHQDYTGIAVINGAPSSQRVYGTIHYQLRRPIGR